MPRSTQLSPIEVAVRAAREAIAKIMKTALDDAMADSRIADAVNDAVRASTSEWLDTDHAAAYLDCSPQHLEIERHHGRGPKFKRFGKRVRYRREWLDQYLTSDMEAA